MSAIQTRYQIGEVIERDARLLIGRWLERARERFPEADEHRREELLNDLTEFVTLLGQAMRSSEDGAADSLLATARCHGRQRWQIDWRLEYVIRDFQILRRVLLEHLEMVFARPISVEELGFFLTTIDEAVAESTRSYVDHRDEESAGAHLRLLRLIMVIGHEMRSPLGACLHALQLIEDGSLDAEKARATRGVLRRQIDQLVRLADDLSDLSRLWRGRIEIESRPLDLRGPVERSAETLRSQIEGKGLSFEVAIPAEPVWVEGDAFRLQQIFNNLLANAARYTDAPGRVRLVLAPAGREGVVRVIDTGKGIPAAFLPRLFQPFSREREDSTTGLGIGLFLVERLVDQHGGSVEVESAGPGQGTEFRVRLPSIEAPPAVPSVEAVVRSSGRRGRILVVDDDPDWAEILRTLLEEAGYEVSVARNADEAEAALRADPPVAALVDLRLPGMSGFDLARRLRAADPSLRLVAYSGLVHEDLSREAREAGFDQVVSKSAPIEDLLRRLPS